MANVGNTDANRDPITGTPGSHPIGTGVGALGGAAAGAAVGAVAGPVGAMVGGAIGAVAGGLAGKGVAEKIDPTVEDTFWKETYKTRPYVERTSSYDDYAPAYRYGWESRSSNQDVSFDEQESRMKQGWDDAKGSSKLSWDKAKPASRDAWERVEQKRTPTGNVGQAMERDIQQTKHDLSGGRKGQDLDQGLADTLKQAVGKDTAPPRGVANTPTSRR